MPLNRIFLFSSQRKASTTLPNVIVRKHLAGNFVRDKQDPASDPLAIVLTCSNPSSRALSGRQSVGLDLTIVGWRRFIMTRGFPIVHRCRGEGRATNFAPQVYRRPRKGRVLSYAILYELQSHCLRRRFHPAGHGYRRYFPSS